MNPSSLVFETAVSLERARQQSLERKVERARKVRSTAKRIAARVWAAKVDENGFGHLTSKDARPIAQDGLVSADEARAQRKLEKYLEKRRRGRAHE